MIINITKYIVFFKNQVNNYISKYLKSFNKQLFLFIKSITELNKILIIINKFIKLLF